MGVAAGRGGVARHAHSERRGDWRTSCHAASPLSRLRVIDGRRHHLATLYLTGYVMDSTVTTSASLTRMRRRAAIYIRAHFNEPKPALSTARKHHVACNLL